MKTFLNLPVKDLNASIEFFTKLGFTFNPQFTDEKATCMIINDESYVMLLVQDYFKSFTNKEIPDTSTAAQLTFAVSLDSKEEVEEKAAIALGEGATDAGLQDMGFMFTRRFFDLDGHLWEIFWMDMSQMQ